MLRMRPIELFVIALCIVGSGVASAWDATINETERFSRESATRRFELRVPTDAQHARLELDARIREGSMEFRLVDAEGGKRWSGAIGRGSTLDISRSFDDAQPGDWRLEIELRDATGTFDIAWSAR